MKRNKVKNESNAENMDYSSFFLLQNQRTSAATYPLKIKKKKGSE